MKIYILKVFINGDGNPYDLELKELEAKEKETYYVVDYQPIKWLLKNQEKTVRKFNKYSYVWTTDQNSIDSILSIMLSQFADPLINKNELLKNELKINDSKIKDLHTRWSAFKRTIPNKGYENERHNQNL